MVAIAAGAAAPLTDAQRTHLARFLEGVPTGHANLARDRIDDTVRWHHPRDADGRPSFPARLAALAGATVPQAPFRIAWRAPPDLATPPFPVYPAALVALLPPGWLADRIVLVGAVRPFDDRHRTPVDREAAGTPGVVVHAHVLAQLLDGRRHPRAPGWAEGLTVAALALLGVALAAGGRPGWGLAGATLAGVLAVWLGAAALFAAGGWLMPPLAPSLAWLGGVGLMAGYRARCERNDRLLLMRLFASHLSGPVADAIWRARDSFLAGGRPRPQELTATVMFTDIEGFTPVCEALAPEPLMRWLETYMDAMARLIDAHGGVALRFLGDGILAAFGVPVARHSPEAVAQDARNAVRCALAMEAELARLNALLAAEDLPPLRIRAGLYTGTMVAGSLGGSHRCEYTLLGDTVNIAARLEQYARQVELPAGRRARIVLGDTTWQAVCGGFEARPVGDVALKGKHNRVRVWHLLGMRADPVPRARSEFA